MFVEKLSSKERRAIFSLSSIMSLRMMGLFMVLPVFSLYASQLEGATPTLIGFSMGIYGLFQAIFQIPFGALSDRLGRKPIIVLGLIIFACGSLIAGLSHSIGWLIVGRSLQGAGAVGSTILAFMADFTREEQRTKAMAIAGITIGFSFSLAMLLGPVLTQWLPVNSLFFLAIAFAFFGIILLYTAVPSSDKISWHRDTEPELTSFPSLLISPELARLNSGIFILHAIFTASFIVIPLSLKQFSGFSIHQQWQLYLPSLLAAFIISLVFIGMAERKQKLKPYFLSGISFLIIAEILLWLAPSRLLFMTLGVCFFFSSFSLLEAFLPSLVSRTAPATRKGSALGIYSCCQFLGIFVGGALGGWLYGKFSFSGVYLLCIILALIWLILAFFMRPPRYLVTRMWRILPSQQANWESLAAKLRLIPGMIEVAFIAEDGIAYLKMEQQTAKHPDLLHLKEQLQSE